MQIYPLRDQRHGLDIGSNSIGWALVDTSANKIVDCGVKIFSHALPVHANQRRIVARQLRRRNHRFAHRLLLHLRHYFSELFYQSAFINKVKKLFPVFIHSLLALLLSLSLLMAAFTKEFQFWFNLAITVLLGWIAFKSKA